MAISVMDAIEGAFERTRQICFAPFDLAKWFTLGFCAFLAGLGQGGGGSFPSGPMGDGGGPSASEVGSWILDHLTPIIIVACGLLLLGLAIGCLLLWLSSRGKFMFLDGVIKNRGAVAEPWRLFGAHGNRLFFFRLCLTLIGAGTFITILTVCGVICIPALAEHRFGSSQIMALVLGLGAILLLALAIGLISAILEDFAIPIMYLRGTGAMPALKAVAGELLPGHFWAFVLFYLMKIALSLAAAMVIVMGACITCCIAALPYISSVVFLPLFVFLRCYSLCFLEQFGPGFIVSGTPTPTGGGG